MSPVDNLGFEPSQRSSCCQRWSGSSSGFGSQYGSGYGGSPPPRRFTVGNDAGAGDAISRAMARLAEMTEQVTLVDGWGADHVFDYSVARLPGRSAVWTRHHQQGTAVGENRQEVDDSDNGLRPLGDGIELVDAWGAPSAQDVENPMEPEHVTVGRQP